MYEQRRSAKINLDRKSVLVWLHSAKLSLEFHLCFHLDHTIELQDVAN